MSLEREYIDLVKSMSSSGVSSMYGLEQRRAELHKDLLRYHGYDADNMDTYLKSKVIMSNLDSAIDYDEMQPSCTPHEESRLYHWLSCAEFYNYMTGKSTVITIGGKKVGEYR